jgi:ABC-type sugar transport system substrate-binding protein
MKVLKSLVLLVAGLLVISACGGSSSGAAKRYKVVFIQQNVGNPYFDAITAGFTKASQELGVCRGDRSDPDHRSADSKRCGRNRHPGQ